MVTHARVGIVGGWLPAVDVGLAVDELQVTGALGVTVASSVPGTGLVAGVLGLATVGVHGDEVQGSVQAAGQLRDIDIEGELLTQELKHLVLRVRSHQEGTATDVLVSALGDEAQLQGSVIGRDAVGGLVVGAIDAAVGSAGLIIRAQVRVPLVAGVAVGRAGSVMSPAPVGVNSD